MEFCQKVEEFSSVVSLGDKSCVVTVNELAGPGVVTAINNCLTCLTCQYGKKHCKHVALLLDLFASNDLPATLHQLCSTAVAVSHPPQVPYDLTCLSQARIAFTPGESMSRVLLKSPEDRFQIEGGVAHLKPVDPTVCPQCEGFIEGKTIVEFFSECTIITLMRSFPAVQFRRKCPCCGLVISFDDMAFRKDFLEKSLFPADTKDDHLPLRSGCDLNRRVYIADSSVRKCLKEVLKGSCSVDDFTNRIGRLTLAGKTTFAELLKDIAMVDCTKNEVSVPHSWVSFIKSCISTSPVCSYIFPSGNYYN
jgi:hypothetical protein